MNQDIDRQLNLLHDILTQEVEIMEQVLGIEKDKYQLLTTKKMVDLSPQVEELEKLLKEEILLEKQRMNLVNNIGFYFKEEEITLTDLIKKLNSDDKKNQLKDVQEKLNSLFDEIKVLNQINKVILEDVLKIVGYSLDMFIDEKNLETNYGDNKNKKKEHRSMLINAVI